jgi:hypothetical protein
VLQKKILPRFHHHSDRQNVVLMLILSSTIVLIPTTHYARSSYLLGCFLAGLCFCTDHHTHDVWSAQVRASRLPGSALPRPLTPFARR